MNSITTVLVILLVIVIIIAGGGYLYKANEVLHEQITDLNTTISNLETRNANLEAELALEQNKSAVLSRQNLNLSQELNEARNTNAIAQSEDTGNNEDRVCISQNSSDEIHTAGIGSTSLNSVVNKIKHILLEIPTSLLLLVFQFLTVAVAILLTAVLTTYFTTPKAQRFPNRSGSIKYSR